MMPVARILAVILLAAAGALSARGASPSDVCEADSLRRAYMAREMALNAPGTPAADFAMRTPDGSTARLSDRRGAPLLLVLFDPECDDCRRALLALAAVRPDGLPALAVFAEGDEELWPRAQAEVPEGWDVALDTDGVYSLGIYSPEFTPGIYLLDADGRVLARSSSPDDIGSKVKGLRLR